MTVSLLVMTAVRALDQPAVPGAEVVELEQPAAVAPQHPANAAHRAVGGRQQQAAGFDRGDGPKVTDTHLRKAGLAPLHPRNNTFPGEVFLHVAVDVLDWCGASRADPLALEGMRERFLPECTFRGRQNKKLQFAILAAAALRGGTEPDLLDEVAWWQTDDFWQYALHAAVAYIRAAAGRAGVPVCQVCQELAQREGPRPE